LREVYVSIVLKDNFIKTIITYTRSIINTEELSLLIDFLEEDKKKSGMTIFLNYLNEQLNLIMDECKKEEDEIKTKLTITKTNENYDLDELVKYIQYDEKSKSKKKTKKKKRIITKEDIEIEEFRINLLKNSQNAKHVKKIKPIISQEWIKNIR
jgi:hypothetical protein